MRNIIWYNNHKGINDIVSCRRAFSDGTSTIVQHNIIMTSILRPFTTFTLYTFLYLRKTDFYRLKTKIYTALNRFNYEDFVPITKRYYHHKTIVNSFRYILSWHFILEESIVSFGILFLFISVEGLKKNHILLGVYRLIIMKLSNIFRLQK